MTSKTCRLSALSLIAALAPALLAPQCHYGSDEVPLGDDTDAGAGVGGAAGSGGASAGGANAGGSGGNAGGAGSSGGSGGTAGGSGSEPPCLEELTEIVGTEHALHEVSAADVVRLLSGKRHAALNHSAGTTPLTLFLLAPRVYHVASRPNPNFPLAIAVDCSPHLRAYGTTRIVTGDGTLDETFANLAWNVPLPLTDGPGAASERIVASAVVTQPRAALGGSYTSPVPSNQCFLSLQFNLNVGRISFTGSLIETIAGAPCAQSQPTTGVSPRDAGQWSCAGDGPDCRSAPDIAVVVPAASCEGLGFQTTASTDLTSFTRQGDVLTREEAWGCGCAAYPEFVMTYTPTSPVELRLCHQDSGDPCEAACGGPLSYALGRALQRAGTTELRFAD